MCSSCAFRYVRNEPAHVLGLCTLVFVLPIVNVESIETNVAI